MAKRKQRRIDLPVVPPRGPATNLRPAGPHADARRRPRAIAERAARAESDV